MLCGCSLGDNLLVTCLISTVEEADIYKLMGIRHKLSDCKQFYNFVLAIYLATSTECCEMHKQHESVTKMLRSSMQLVRFAATLSLSSPTFSESTMSTTSAARTPLRRSSAVEFLMYVLVADETDGRRIQPVAAGKRAEWP